MYFIEGWIKWHNKAKDRGLVCTHWCALVHLVLKDGKVGTVMVKRRRILSKSFLMAREHAAGWHDFAVTTLCWIRSQVASLSGIGPRLICFAPKQRWLAQIDNGGHAASGLGAQDPLLVLRAKAELSPV